MPDAKTILKIARKLGLEISRMRVGRARDVRPLRTRASAHVNRFVTISCVLLIEMLSTTIDSSGASSTLRIASASSTPRL